MPVETVINLVDALRQFRLLETEQYEEVIRTLAVRFPEPKALAKDLLQRGWLTPFQVNQIFLNKGQELALGRYILLDRLGEGGMGQVFRARQTSIGRVVALKVIRKDRLRSEQAAKRFQREIRAASKLRHPNVVQAIDAEQVGDTHFFAMEYVEGVDLGKFVKTHGPVAPTEACEFIRQAALGLQHAYEHNLIHRDIKPANLLVTKQDRVVKILDMGLVRDDRGGEAGEDSSSTLTQENAVMGTPDYLAPEQARDAHTVDIRADIYSLGCTLYFLISGRVPFPGGQLGEKLIKHQLELATPLSQLRNDVPTEVENVVQRLMAKRPEERYQTPADLAAALASLLSGERPLTVAVPAAPPAAPAANPFVDLSGGETLPSGDTSTSRKAASDTSPSLNSRLTSLATGTRTFTDKYVAPLLVGAEQKLSPLVQKVGVPAGQVRLVLLGVLGLFFLLMVGCWFKGRQSPVIIQDKQSEVKSVPPTFASSPLDLLSEGMIPNDDRHDWLPKETVAIVGELRGRHPGGMQRLALSYDGKYLATTGPDNVIRIWHPNSLRNLFVLDKHTGPIHALHFSPASNLLVSAGADKTIRFWDLTGSAPTDSFVLKDHDTAIHSLSVSGDGKWLAATGANKALFLWDLSGPVPERKFHVTDFAEDSRAVALSPAGDVLVACDLEPSPTNDAVRTGSLRIWDLSTMPPVEQPKVIVSSARLYALRFAQDGKALVAGASGVVHLFDVAATKLTEVGIPLSAAGIVTSLAFSRKADTFAAVGDKIDLYKWYPDGWKPLKRTEGPSPPVGVEWFHDNKSLVTGHSCAPILYWILKGSKIEPTSNLVGHLGETFALAFSSDGKFLATSGGNFDQRVLIWSLESPAPQLVRTIAADARIHALAFAPDGKYLAGASMNHTFVSVWDLTSKDVKAVALQSNAVKGHGKGVRSLIFFGPMLITGGFGEICTWDFRKGIPREPVDYQVKHQANWIGALALSDDGKRLASGGFDGQIVLWDISTKSFPVYKAIIPRAHTQPITHLEFEPLSKRLVSGGQDKAVRCWDPGSLAEIKDSYPGHNDHIAGISFGSTQICIADRSGQFVVRYTASPQRSPRTWKLDTPITSARFAPDGRHLAVATAASATLILRLPVQ